MTNASAVARYFLSLSDEEAGDTISNLKLQKLLYYGQGFHLALFGVPMFPDEIQAWTHGPVVPDIYHAYKTYGSNSIPRPENFDPQDISEEVRELLDEVYNVYGQYSAWKLRNMTHSEAPWVEAYAKAPGSVVARDGMREFFKTLTQ
jgi:uncharacterized phage-associated protein